MTSDAIGGILRSDSRDAMSHNIKGAQVTTISRLRKREGRQRAVPMLVPFEPALVLPTATGYIEQPD